MVILLARHFQIICPVNETKAIHQLQQTPREVFSLTKNRVNRLHENPYVSDYHDFD